MEYSTFDPNEMAVPQIVGIVEKVLTSFQRTIEKTGRLQQDPWITTGCPAGEKYDHKIFDAHSWFSFLVPLGSSSPIRRAFDRVKEGLEAELIQRAVFRTCKESYSGRKTKTKDPEILQLKLDNGILLILLTSEYEKDRGQGVLGVEVAFRPYRDKYQKPLGLDE
jgi:hypothetical protein